MHSSTKETSSINMFMWALLSEINSLTRFQTAFKGYWTCHQFFKLIDIFCSYIC